jgi:hypothetical protein
VGLTGDKIADSDRSSTQTQLFTLRVWMETVADERREFRGALTHVLSGETYHFRDWQALTQLIESHLATTQIVEIGEIS